METVKLTSAVPVIRDVQVFPVAGYDSMLLNLSGAHSPFFTRNVLVIEDSVGNIGVGEVPGGEAIAKTIEEAIPLILNKKIGQYKTILSSIRQQFSYKDKGGEVYKPLIYVLPFMLSQQ